jgi:hypothetical protein
LLSEGYELLHSTVTARENQQGDRRGLRRPAQDAQGTGSFFDKNGDKIEASLDNVER